MTTFLTLVYYNKNNIHYSIILNYMYLHLKASVFLHFNKLPNFALCQVGLKLFKFAQRFWRRRTDGETDAERKVLIRLNLSF